MNESTSLKILKAAKQEFVIKGFSGARMQEIADSAGINKALLHYYFRTKEQLFQRVFEEALAGFINSINEVFESDASIFEKINSFVNQYIDRMIENPFLPSFVLHELNQNPEGFIQRMGETGKFPRPQKFLIQLENGIKEGLIKPISTINFMVNMISMCVFPFIGKPVIQSIFHLDDKDYKNFLEMRKKELSSFFN